ncbi:MAG: fructose 1,6-bisphosphatase [Croceitalea sp.]|nr:fructose 1,6-bisphosphatase [Croceitalea sp.]
MFEPDKSVIKLNQKDEATASKIELIKQLIFGENIQAYESEFELLKKDILEKRRVLEGLVEEVRTELSNTIDNLSTDMNIRITELEENLEQKFENLEKDHRDTLSNVLIELGEKLAKK